MESASLTNTPTHVDRPAATARAAAVVTWAYAAGFGAPTVPVAVYLLQRGRLPSFFGMFDMYAGPWSKRLEDGPFVVLLISFLPVTAAAAWAARRVWRGSRRGAVISLALLPLEAVFWIGFALPIPWMIGAARVALLAAARRRLR
jgi:hypothetical protein